MALYNITDTTVPTILNGGINASVLTITVVDGSSYPAADFIVLLEAEEIDIQSRTGNVFTVRTGGRGYGDTVGATHADTVGVTHVVTNQDLPWRRTVGTALFETNTDLSMAGFQLSNPLDPTAGTHMFDRDYGDARYMQIGDAPTAHTIASHSDTTATGTELNTLTGGGSTTLHSHSIYMLSGAAPNAHTIASHSDTTGTGAELNTLTSAGNADSLHVHADAGITLNVAEIDDVTITTVGTGEVITKSAGNWINQTLAEAGIMAVGAAPTAHTIASHSDTTGTGAELNTLTGGGATTLHSHSVAHSATTGKTANDHHNESHTVASHSDTTATGANLNTLVGGGSTTLHSHSIYMLSGAAPNAHTLDSHSNVTITTIATGELLKWSGTAWINNTLAEANIMAVGAAPTAHTIASHSDTTGTGAELNTLTGGGSTTLHSHSIYMLSGAAPNAHTIASHSDTTGTGAELNTLTGGGSTTLHSHSIYMLSGAAPNAHTLDSHSNVTITTIATGELLKWSGTAWINNTLAEAGIMAAGAAPTAHTIASHSDTTGTGAELNTLTGGGSTTLHSHSIYMLSGAAPNAHTIASHSDTTATGANLNTLVGGGSTTLHSHSAPAHTIASHSDVTITTIATGELLKWNGSIWINNTLAEAGIMAVGAAPTAHTIASHSDTTGTGAELNTLTSAGSADSLHTHPAYIPTTDYTDFVAVVGDTMTGALLTASGTEALPGLSFASDTNSGRRWISSDKFADVLGGSDFRVYEPNFTELINADGTTSGWIEHLTGATRRVVIISGGDAKRGATGNEPWVGIYGDDDSSTPRQIALRTNNRPWMTINDDKLRTEVPIKEWFNGGDAEDQDFTGTIGGTAVTPTGTVAWTQARGRLSVSYEDVGTADLCARLYSVTPALAQYIETKFKWMHSDTTFHHAGLMMSDGTATTSNAYAAIVYWDGTNIIFREYEGTITSMTAGTSITMAPHGGDFYIRIMEVTNDVFQAEISPDGVSWIAMATEPKTLGVTHAGPCVSNWNGASDVAIASFEYMRLI